MPVKKLLAQHRVPIKVWTDAIEDEALKQLENLAKLPFIFKQIAVMPDVHAGKGSTIGAVIATQGAIIPAAVGVDIGCGMCAVRLPFKVDLLGDSLTALRDAIEEQVPVGFHSNATSTSRTQQALASLGKIPTASTQELKKALLQLGSLGGGNHFIEICQDKKSNAWVVIHSGSRHIGKALADKHINTAKGLMKKHLVNLEDKDLAFLTQGTAEFEAYLHDLLWAQRYAKENRKEILQRVLQAISLHVYGEDKGAAFLSSFAVDCHHNYTQKEKHFGKQVWVTRKGALSAREGEFGIIPGSMGTRSYIVQGRGNPESFCSCSHGAGRKMSRTKARQLYTTDDLKQQTLGVECRKDKNVIDEIPAAYKNIDEVMANQEDLVVIEEELKQLICIKG